MPKQRTTRSRTIKSRTVRQRTLISAHFSRPDDERLKVAYQNTIRKHGDRRLWRTVTTEYKTLIEQALKSTKDPATINRLKFEKSKASPKRLRERYINHLQPGVRTSADLTPGSPDIAMVIQCINALADNHTGGQKSHRFGEISREWKRRSPDDFLADNSVKNFILNLEKKRVLTVDNTGCYYDANSAAASAASTSIAGAGISAAPAPAAAAPTFIASTGVSAAPTPVAAASIFIAGAGVSAAPTPAAAAGHLLDDDEMLPFDGIDLDLDMRRAELDARETKLNAQEASLAEQARAIAREKSALKEETGQLQQKKARLKARLEAEAQRLRQIEARLNSREQALLSAERDLSTRDAAVSEREEALNTVLGTDDTKNSVRWNF